MTKLSTKEDLAELIRVTMAKRRITAVKLAEATGMTPEYISQIKNGHRNLSFEATTRLLAALNLELTAEERGDK